LIAYGSNSHKKISPGDRISIWVKKINPLGPTLNWSTLDCSQYANLVSNRSKMTLNYHRIVKRYPNQMEWLAVQFLGRKIMSLLDDETNQVINHLMCSKKKKWCSYYNPFI
jgi:hypothetical protein